ncbi:hypothetical protein HK101_010712, partial [Irineochytrium annulatum]
MPALSMQQPFFAYPHQYAPPYYVDPAPPGGYIYQQPAYGQAPPFATFGQPMIRPPQPAGPGVPPTPPQGPRFPPVSQPPQPYPATPNPPAQKSKAIRIVNPLTKEEIKPGAAAAASPAVVPPARQPEKQAVQVVLKDQKGNTIDFKSPSTKSEVNDSPVSEPQPAASTAAKTAAAAAPAVAATTGTSAPTAATVATTSDATKPGVDKPAGVKPVEKAAVKPVEKVSSVAKSEPAKNAPKSEMKDRSRSPSKEVKERSPTREAKDRSPSREVKDRSPTREGKSRSPSRDTQITEKAGASVTAPVAASSAAATIASGPAAPATTAPKASPQAKPEVVKPAEKAAVAPKPVEKVSAKPVESAVPKSVEKAATVAKAEPVTKAENVPSTTEAVKEAPAKPIAVPTAADTAASDDNRTLSEDAAPEEVVPEKEAEAPAILVSTASDESLAVVPDTADMEEGEIAETVTDKGMTDEPEEKIDAATAEKIKAAISPVNRPPVAVKTLTFDDVKSIIYPESVTAYPKIVNGIAKYPKEFLELFNRIVTKPPGLNLSEFSEENKGNQRGPQRNSSASGSGYGSYQGSAGNSGTHTPKGRPSVPTSKSGMPVVPTPATARGPGFPSRSMSNQSNTFGSRAGQWESGKQQVPSRSSMGSRRPPPPAEPPVEQLVKTENAWVPAARSNKVAEEDPEKAAEEKIVKKAQGLLNKLTIEMFDRISDQFLALDITTQIRLKRVIELVFDKALDEVHFQNMYGRLCQKLSAELPRVQKWIEMDAKNNIFRRLLLNKCQEEFERSEKWSKSDEDGALTRKEMQARINELTAEEKLDWVKKEEARSKLKRRVLGNISFIGELFKLGMITEKIMHSCVRQLLVKVSDPEEEETESLCKLLRSIGERLDHEKAKQHMDVYFARVGELSKNTKLPSRIRFMLIDLIEQRRNKWKARQESLGPMTIQEINEREEKKQREEEERMRREQANSRGG